MIDDKKQLNSISNKFEESSIEFSKNVDLDNISEKDDLKNSIVYQDLWKNYELQSNNYREIPDDIKDKYNFEKNTLEILREKIDENKNLAVISPAMIREEMRHFESDVKRYLKSINKQLSNVMSNFDASARLIFDPIYDEFDLTYKAGIKIIAKFGNQSEFSVDDDTIKLSGGQKTKLIIGILLSLIKNSNQNKKIPFIVLDEFDAQLDDKSHDEILKIFKSEIGADQIIIISPSRTFSKANFSDMFILFTNSDSEPPEFRISAEKTFKDGM